MSTAFDLEAFANTANTLDAPLSTKMLPIPEGEYQAVATKQELRTTNSGKVVLEVTWEIDDQSVREATSREHPTSRQGIFLDITPQGTLDRSQGKNIGLGKLLEALGMNVPGRPFSYADIVGQVAKVHVKHRQVEDNTYDEVKGVNRI